MVASRIPIGLPIAGCIQLDGCNVDYVDVGSGDPVVVVPGLAGGIDLTEPLILALAQNHRVVAANHRGEDWSYCEKPFGFRQLVADLSRVIDTLRLERPGLVGVSLGGAVALEYAVGQPNSISFVAVQGTARKFQPGIFGEIARAVLGRLPLPEDNPFLHHLFRILAGKRNDRRRIRFIAERCWQTDQAVMAQRLALLDEYDLTDRLGELTMPALVLAGEEDVLVHPREAAALAAGLPDARFETIPDAGHMAFVTHAAEFCRRLAAVDGALQTA